jgi:hypothetical protein
LPAGACHFAPCLLWNPANIVIAPFPHFPHGTAQQGTANAYVAFRSRLETSTIKCPRRPAVLVPRIIIVPALETPVIVNSALPVVDAIIRQQRVVAALTAKLNPRLISTTIILIAVVISPIIMVPAGINKQ